MGSSKEGHPVCWGHRSKQSRFRRLVLVIVDALRYDFVMPMDGGSVTQGPQSFFTFIKHRSVLCLDHAHMSDAVRLCL